MVTIAKGSFGADLESPTMESLESVAPGMENEQHSSRDSPPSSNGSSGRRVTIAYEDEDGENDETQRHRNSRRSLGGPISSRSLRSMQSGDQVLDLSSAIDLSDSSAILSRVKKHRQPQQEQEQPQQHPTRPMSGSSPSPVKAGLQGPRRTLSRRPSMHETYDCEVLMNGGFLYHLYSLAILGTSIRIFMGRLFGQDCENPGAISDFLSPLSERICVTATGETAQQGGALFIDLPANILGCFIMGMVSSLSPEAIRPGGKLPWLRKEHPLQDHEGLYQAIKVGLCGSLTTFSSWNTQMVAMLDGSGTALGPQVMPALFGYIIGMTSSTAAFMAGGRCYEWLYNWSNRRMPSERMSRSAEEDEEQPTSWDTEDSHHRTHHSSSTSPAVHRHQLASRLSSSVESSGRWARSHLFAIFLHQALPFVLVVGLLVFYGIADGVLGIQFYKELWAGCLLTPVGVHLRWKLATLNGRGIGPNHRFDWVPWGTLICNVMAAVIAIIFQALKVKYLQDGSEDGIKYPWVVAIVVGMKTGLGGSLSTVSSMVKEIVNLGMLYPTHAKATYYGGGTIVISMFFGLCIYSPMMRYG